MNNSRRIIQLARRFGRFFQEEEEPVFGVSWLDPNDPVFTFTRASAASDGSPETGLPINDVDFYGVDVIRDVSAKLGEPGWVLLEGARTNAVVNSTTLAGVDTGTVTVTGGQTDPAGNTDAYRIETASGNNHRELSMTGAGSAGSFLRTSIFVREAPSYQNLGGGSGTAANRRAIGGTVGSSWQRVKVGNVTALDSAASLIFYLSDARDLVSFGGVAQGARDGIYAFPQMETDVPFASSYIPTTGSVATRAADGLRTLSNPASWFDGTKVFVTEYRPNHSSTEMNQLGTGAHANPFLFTTPTASHYVRFINGSVGSSAVSVRTIAPGASLITRASINWNAGDLLRFELFVAAGILKVFKNGVFQFDMPAGGWQGLSGSALWFGSSATLSNCVFGTFRIGVVDAPQEPSTTWVDPTTDVTFTRASSATDGAPEVGLPADNVSSYGTDVIRDVSSKMGGPGWVLLEGARTNRVLDSVNMLTSSWEVAGTAVIHGSLSDPMGGMGAVDYSSGASLANAFRTVSVLSHAVAGSPPKRVVSAWTKGGPGEINDQQPLVSIPSTTGSNWQRVSLFGDWTNNGRPYSINATNAHVWGWQVEPAVSASFPSSLISTSGAAATRADDRLSFTPTKLTDFDLSSNILVFEWRPERASTEPAQDPSGIERLMTVDGAGRGITLTATNQLVVTTSTANITIATFTWSRGDLLRLEVNWNTGTTILYRNGVAINGNFNATPGTMGIFSGWRIGRANNLGNEHFFGVIRVGRKGLRPTTPV